MVTNFRQREILDLARKDGKVTVEGLSEHYDVTVQTIRRDLAELTDSGQLERVHGGAVVPSGVVNIVYQERRRLNASGKQAIAETCAQTIPNGASVFMNIGTSTEAVAQSLLDHQNLLVSMTTIRPSSGFTAHCTFEPPVSTPISRRTAMLALRMI